MAKGKEECLYSRIEKEIEQAISDKVYLEGQQIPTESELCARYGVSRITVRKAITNLINKELLESRRGKGVFVAKRKMNHLMLCGHGFAASCRDNGRVPSSKILQISIQYASEEDVQKLRLSPEDKVLFILRVLCADGIPVMLEYNYFVPRFLPLIQCDLENTSIYQLIKEKFGISGFTTEASIELTSATREEAAMLDTRENSAVLLVQEVEYDCVTGEPVHRTRQVVIGKYWTYNISTRKQI